MLKQRVTEAKRPPSVRAGAVEPEEWRRGERFHISLTTPLGSGDIGQVVSEAELLEAS